MYLLTWAQSCIVQEGDRVAQLIIEKIETPEVLEVDVSTPEHSCVINAKISLRISRRLFVVPEVSAPRADMVRSERGCPYHLTML